MNELHLVGRLARDPKFMANNGGGVCFMTIITNRGWNKKKKEPITKLVNVAVWGDLGERCANNLVKGSLISGRGFVESKSYEKGGNQVFTTDVILEEIDFLAKPKGASGK